MEIGIETSIALCSAFVALAALGASIWQGYCNARHQELSVIPHLTLDFDCRKTDDVSIVLRSNGIGPALITNYGWIIDGKAFSPRSNDDFRSILEVLGLGKPETEFYVPDIGGYLEPGFRQFLVRIVDSAGADNHDDIRKKIFGARILIQYKSVYGRGFERVYDGGYA